jgi:hypothetical protein
MKFNTIVRSTSETTHYMGGKAYKLNPAVELYTTVVSTMLDNSYYEKRKRMIV